MKAVAARAKRLALAGKALAEIATLFNSEGVPLPDRPEGTPWHYNNVRALLSKHGPQPAGPRGRGGPQGAAAAAPATASTPASDDDPIVLRMVELAATHPPKAIAAVLDVEHPQPSGKPWHPVSVAQRLRHRAAATTTAATTAALAATPSSVAAASPTVAAPPALLARLGALAGSMTCSAIAAQLNSEGVPLPGRPAGTAWHFNNVRVLLGHAKAAGASDLAALVESTPDAFTRALVRAAAPRDKMYELSDGALPGFILRVLPSGKKVFLVRYRHNGKDRRERLGLWGTEITIEEARERARTILARAHAVASDDESGGVDKRLSQRSFVPPPAGSNPVASSIISTTTGDVDKRSSQGLMDPPPTGSNPVVPTIPPSPRVARGLFRRRLRIQPGHTAPPPGADTRAPAGRSAPGAALIADLSRSLNRLLVERLTPELLAVREAHEQANVLEKVVGNLRAELQRVRDELNTTSRALAERADDGGATDGLVRSLRGRIQELEALLATDYAASAQSKVAELEAALARERAERAEEVAALTARLASRADVLELEALLGDADEEVRSLAAQVDALTVRLEIATAAKGTAAPKRQHEWLDFTEVEGAVEQTKHVLRSLWSGQTWQDLGGRRMRGANDVFIVPVKRHHVVLVRGRPGAEIPVMATTNERANAMRPEDVPKAPRLQQTQPPIASENTTHTH